MNKGVVHIFEMTELHCPNCGKRSSTKIRWGEVVEYCRSCKQTYEVKIQMVPNAEKDVPSDSKQAGSESH